MKNSMWSSKLPKIYDSCVQRLAELSLYPDHVAGFSGYLERYSRQIDDSNGFRRRAIEMLAQFLLLHPALELLFDLKETSNPMMRELVGMQTYLSARGFRPVPPTIKRFYTRILNVCSYLGTDSLHGTRLTTLNRIVEQFYLGIGTREGVVNGVVFTPYPIVDFILDSAEYLLESTFNRTFGDNAVRLFDPFGGTGSFLIRALHHGVYGKNEIFDAFEHEMRFYEVNPLLYVLASFYVESAYRGIAYMETGKTESNGFWGGYCRDTFATSPAIFTQVLPVILSNPPYFAHARNANNGDEKQFYPALDGRIKDTYVKESTAQNKNSLHDSAYLSLRWASDVVQNSKNGGIIGFITNNSFIHASSADGVRKCLEREFDEIYIVDLRGNRLGRSDSEEVEGENIFGHMSRTGSAIVFLVRKPNRVDTVAKIRYVSIGRGMDRAEKLTQIQKWGSIEALNSQWNECVPNERHDWIDQCSELYASFLPIRPRNRSDCFAWFNSGVISPGIGTQRDCWAWNSSRSALVANMKKTIDFYNQQVDDYQKAKQEDPSLRARDFVTYDSTLISWAHRQIADCEAARHVVFKDDSEVIRKGMYHPFFKQWIYFDAPFAVRITGAKRAFPDSLTREDCICVSQRGSRTEYGVFMVNCIPDAGVAGSRCLLIPRVVNGKSTISDFTLATARAKYGIDNLEKDDLFYYVYGILHSRIFRTAFANDLKKNELHIPFVRYVDSFVRFVNAGRVLADLHVNYEDAPIYPNCEVVCKPKFNPRVKRMHFGVGGSKSTISVNEQVSITNIPRAAFKYTISGRSALEWVMSSYQVRKDRASGIVNDPNEWGAEMGDPDYIVKLLLKVVTVSLETVKVIDSLPDPLEGMK